MADDDLIEPPAAGDPRRAAPVTSPVAAAPPPGFMPVTPPPGFKPVSDQSAPPPGFKAVGVGGEQSQKPPGMMGRIWENLKTHGNMLGREGALEESAKMAPAYKPGMTAGQMIPKNWEENPMLGALGPQNMRAVGSAMGRAWEQILGGSKASPETLAQRGRLADYEAAGISPNVPAIGQSRGAGISARIANLAPGGAIPKALEKTQQETSLAIDRAASKYGTAEDRFTGGNIASNAMKRFFADRSESEQNYNEFFRTMYGAPPVELPKTLGTLRNFMGRFESEPALRGLFTKPVIQRLASILEPRTETIPAKTSPIMDPFGLPATVTPASTVKRGGALAMPEIKELRTQLGYMMEHPGAGPEEIPKAQLRQLYGALTQDMRTAAAKRSPAAARALANATTSYAMRQRQMERLAPLISPQAPERTLALIERAAQSDSNLLQAARRVMAPDEWGNVGASVIRGLGKAPASVAGEEMPFSVKTFAQNWSKLSPRSKDLLFGDAAAGLPRDGLERLARIASSERAVEGFGRSALAQGVASGAVIMSIVNSVVGGHLPIPGIAAAGAGYGLGKLLMNPGFTRWLYAAPKIIESGDPQTGFQRGVQALEAAMRGVAIEEAGQRPKRAPAQRPQQRSEAETDRELRSPVAG